jgi:hypothetical protein
VLAGKHVSSGNEPCFDLKSMVIKPNLEIVEIGKKIISEF